MGGVKWIANSKEESKGEDMGKKINVGDIVYLLLSDKYVKRTVIGKQKKGNRFYYLLNGYSIWYPRERLALTEKEAVTEYAD